MPRRSGLMMSVDVTETTPGDTFSTRSAKEGRAMGERARAGVAAADSGGVAFWAAAVRVRSRPPARIIPKTTEAATSAVTEITLVLVRIVSFRVPR